MSHIQKRCQAISRADKHRAFIQLQELPEPENGIDALPNEQSSQDGDVLHRICVKLPTAQGEKFTGLEALAEAGRQIERPEKGEWMSQQEDLIDPSLRDHLVDPGSLTSRDGEQDKLGE